MLVNDNYVFLSERLNNSKIYSIVWKTASDQQI